MKRVASEKNIDEALSLGEYIVADPGICHGKVTFKGTRIFVADVLEDVQNGLSWDFIIQRWGGGKLTKAAISEAVRLSQSAWLDDEGRLVRKKTAQSLPRAA